MLHHDGCKAGPVALPLRGCLLLGFALAARRSASPLWCGCRSHPRWGPSAALPSSARQVFDSQDGFLDLSAFLLQFRDHLQNVHAGSIAQSSFGKSSARAGLVAIRSMSASEIRSFRIVPKNAIMPSGCRGLFVSPRFARSLQSASRKFFTPRSSRCN